MQDFLLTPPIAWTVLAAASFGLFSLAGLFKARSSRRGHDPQEIYACGEQVSEETRPFSGVGPEYEAFFGSVLFFTVTEVAVLLMITLPRAGKIPPVAGALVMVVLLCSAGLLGELRGARR
jgi:NADH:ubiquinone oxidoreductase subunit 3 (subunit A)